MGSTGGHLTAAARRRLVLAAGLGIPAVGLTFFAISVWGSRDPGDLPVLWQAPVFALVDQAGDTLRTEDLRGTAWVASFVFTNCTGVCPLVTARMARVRDSLAADGRLGETARLVSITVDPARDTPEVLRNYASNFGGSPPSEWAFLTGGPPEAVRRIIQEGFKVTALLGPEAADTAADYQVSHSPHLELVDSAGRVRAIYDATDPETVERLLADLEVVGP